MVSRPKIKRPLAGDVYRVNFDGMSGFFQYLCDDSSQLSSNVIVVLKLRCKEDESPDLKQILESGIDLFVHVLVKLGLKFGLWALYGSTKPILHDKLTFRDTLDYGLNCASSNKWVIWDVDGPRKEVVASPHLEKYWVGVVAAPVSLIRKMSGGVLFVNYPAIALKE